MTLYTFTEAELITAFLVFVRTAALLLSNPLFGNNSVPTRMRVVFAVFTSFVLIPVIPSTPGLSFGMFEMAARIAHEALIGLSMGFLVTILFSIVAIAGHLASTVGGLQMAQMFDPSLQTQSTVLGTIKTIVLFMVVLSTNLHHLIFYALVKSFQAIPPGSGFGGARAGFYLIRQFSDVLQAAMILAIPVLLVVFIINLSMAIIARIAPQMNIFFSIGGSINEQATVLVVAFSLPAISALLSGMMSGLGDRLLEMVKQFQ